MGASFFALLLLLLIPTAFAEGIDYDELLLKLQNQRQELSLPTYLDKQLLGELSLIIQGETIISISGEDLISKLPVIKKVRQQLVALVKDGFIRLEDLARLDIDLTYDPVSLRVVAQVPLSLLRTKVISGLGAVRKAELMRAPDGYSFFLNGRYGFQELETTDTSTAAVAVKEHGLDLEFGLSVNGWLLEAAGAGTRQVDTSTDHWRRNYTRLVYDNISHGARLNIGDLSYGVDAFQFFAPLAGIGYSSNSQLTSTRVGRATGSESFYLDDTSRVEVYVNNRLVRTLYLDRGNYEIRDLPGVSGVNDVRLIVSNAQGEQNEFGYSFLFSQNLLAKGEHDFSYNVGVLREYSVSGNVYGQEPVLSFYHRYGVSNGLTFGANLQANTEHYMPGVSIHLASNIGALLAQINSSRQQGSKAVQAYRLQYRFEKRELGQLDVSTEYYDANFSSPNKTQILSTENRRSQTVLSVSRTLNSRLIGFANYRHTVSRSEYEFSRSWEVGFATRLFSRLRLNFVASRYYENNQWEDTAFRVDLSWQAFKGNQLLNSQYETRNELFRTNYSSFHISEQHEFNNRISYQAHGQNNTRTGGVFQYANHRLESSATLEEFNSDSSYQTYSRIGVGGAVVMADNQWAFSRPVSGGFAVVDTNVDLKGNVIGVNPRPGGGYQSVISRWSPAVITGLSPYYFQPLTVNAEGTDLEYDQAIQNNSVTTNYRSGARVYIQGDSKKMVVGRIFSDQEAVQFSAGEVILMDKDKDKEVAHMFFTNGEGEFLIEGLEPGLYRLEIYGGDYEATTFDIKPGANKKVIIPDLQL